MRFAFIRESLVGGCRRGMWRLPNCVTLACGLSSVSMAWPPISRLPRSTGCGTSICRMATMAFRRQRVEEIATAVQTLPGPIYIHCHHGKHRSPAASAAACVGAGLIEPAESARDPADSPEPVLTTLVCFTTSRPHGADATQKTSARVSRTKPRRRNWSREWCNSNIGKPRSRQR